MANLKDYTESLGIDKATDSKLGLVKGGGDTHINDNGQIEIINSYGGPFKVSLDGTTVYISSGRIHIGNDPEHLLVTVEPSQTLTVTTGTLNAIWIIINESGNTSYVKTNSSIQAPSVSTPGTYFCILLGMIVYNGGVAYIQQCHYGDIIINGISY